MKVEGVHHLKTTGDAFGGEFRGAADLGRADAHTEHIKAVIPGQDPGTPADPAAHIQNTAASGKLIEAAPAHQLVHEGLLGLAEIDLPWWVAVMPKVHMITPESFQQAVIGPCVVGGRNTV